MDADDAISPKDATLPPSEESISIIKGQDFVEIQLEDETDWESEHPIFMTKLPDEENSGLLALQDLKYSEGTPEEVADALKDQGNEFLARGKQFYKHALECYTKALAEKVNDPIRTSVYYSNRAAVNLEMGNYARTIDDCKKAIESNPKNLKAFFRAARASSLLDKYEQALAYIDDALKVDAKNPGLLKERQEIELSWGRHKARVEAALERQRKLERERESVMKQKGAWVKMLHERNVAIGPYLFESINDYLTSSGTKPYLNKQDKEIHWPVLFLYDEYRQLDFIQDFAENDTFGDHLKVMFPGDSFCEWDAEQKYVHSKIEIFFVVNQSPAFLKKEANPGGSRPRKIKVNHTTPLRKVLEHPEYVVPGYPVFYIVVAGSKFKEEFLKRRFDLGQE